jgi:hypothetical protein
MHYKQPIPHMAMNNREGKRPLPAQLVFISGEKGDDDEPRNYIACITGPLHALAELYHITSFWNKKRVGIGKQMVLQDFVNWHVHDPTLGATSGTSGATCREIKLLDACHVFHPFATDFRNSTRERCTGLLHAHRGVLLPLPLIV